MDTDRARIMCGAGISLAGSELLFVCWVGQTAEGREMGQKLCALAWVVTVKMARMARGLGENPQDSVA